MGRIDSGFDEASIMGRFDRTSPELLLKTIAAEFAQLYRMQSRLVSQVAAMEFALAAVDRIAADAKLAPSPGASTITIKATDACEAAIGFYELEHDEKGGGFRWSGPDKQFSFKFSIDRRVATRFVLRFDGLFADIPVENLLCFVDGDKTELTLHRFATGYEASGAIPARYDSRGAVITFECPAMGSPLSRGLPDNRQLGLQFRQLNVRADEGASQALLTPPPKLPEPLAITPAPDSPNIPPRRHARSDDNTVVFMPIADVKLSARQRP